MAQNVRYEGFRSWRALVEHLESAAEAAGSASERAQILLRAATLRERRLGEQSEANRAYKEAYRADKRCFVALQGARRLLRLRGRVDEKLIQLFEIEFKALKKAGPSGGAPDGQAAATHIEHGWALLVAGSDAKALSAFKQALYRAPDDPAIQSLVADMDDDADVPTRVTELRAEAGAAADARAAERLEQIGADQTRGLEKQFMLQMIDMQWREHLVHLDHLRGVIGLRGYGQRDPLNEYKTEAFALFENLLYDLRHNVTRWLMTVEFRFQPPPEMPEFQEIHLNPGTGENEMANPSAQNPEGTLIGDDRSKLPVEALPPGWEMTGRNSPCPCGSGRKFKHCHGALV